MKQWNWGMWLISLSCWMPLALAAPSQDAPASSVQPIASQIKKVSANPEQDYKDGLRLMLDGDKYGDLGMLIDAAEHFRLAADAGHSNAQVQFGLSLERGQSHEEAMKYYKLSADQNNMEGQYRLASMYAAGEGTAQDLGEARKWFILAAQQGQKNAVIVMAEAYMLHTMTADELADLKQRRPRVAAVYIRTGLGIDEAARLGSEAVAWIQRAADIDYLPALDALAAAYRSGQLGLVADTQKADAIVDKTNKLRGIVPVAERKKSGLYKFLRGDDAAPNPEKPK